MAAKWGILVVVVLAFVAAQVTRSPAETPDNGWPVTSHAERDGLLVWAWFGVAADGPVVEVAVENRRDEPVQLVADQCGRVSQATLESTRPIPEGKTWTGSIQAVKSLVLAARKPVPEHFAPRRTGDDSNATPDCTATHGPVTLAPGETVRERWARFSPDRLDAARTRVVVEAVEHGGRAVRIETPTAELIAPDPEVPAPRLSPGERFDRAMKDAALREAIAAEPAGSWVHADVIDVGDRVLFKAISRRYERAFTATRGADGRMSVSLPGPRDRARAFPAGRATLPPGIGLVAGSRRPTRDLTLGDVVLPSGRVVSDDVSGGSPLRSRYAAEPGTYPVRVTLARGRVALATLVVSDRHPVRWRRDRGVATDGGTASFTSPEAERVLKNAGPDRWTRWFDSAFDAMTAHDYIGASRDLPGGTNMVLFSTGYGDGGYPLYVGLDADGRPARYVLDFRVLDLSWR